MEYFSLKKFANNQLDQNPLKPSHSKRPQPREFDFLKRVSQVKNQEKIEEDNSQSNSNQKNTNQRMVIGSPGVLRDKIYVSKSKHVSPEELNMKPRMSQIEKQIESKINLVKSQNKLLEILTVDIKDNPNQELAPMDEVSKKKYLSFQRRARSKSPPHNFGKPMITSKTQDKALPDLLLNSSLKVQAKIALIHEFIMNSCNESTQESYRMLFESKSRDYNELAMIFDGDFEDNEMVKEIAGINRMISEDMINERLEQMITQQDHQQQLPNLQTLILESRVSTNSADQELEKWLGSTRTNNYASHTREDNPFGVVDENELELLRDASYRSSNSDWLYQTKI
ncbi:UNKNOWN [Stylonychia lemnae]|uniref:Uncharacterized protein n=1 Tax=Stylonychia lemnae TaxID=5949 RepID=A0A078AQA4_STYLE|nr:UNKNOWN [Stylonychia lemnae]|eukprot:CDW84344.1 UNKNOWN [Stylonychia lemnae]